MKHQPQSPRVALVYDWLTTSHGGAEKVLLALHQVFPQAPLYTSIFDAHHASWANVFDVKTTWLQSLSSKNHRLLSLLMPIAFESFDFSEYDLIVSISSAEAKGIMTLPHQLHLAYVLTPPRYLYSHQDEYLAALPLTWLSRWLLKLPLAYLKWWDQVAAFRPDVMVPISKLVGSRIKEYYHRQSSVPLYPPVQISAISGQISPELRQQFPILGQQFYLVVSRLIDYKRIDLAIEACLKSDHQLVVIGDGPASDALKQLVPDSQRQQIQFLGSQPQSVVDAFRQQCQALVMPGIEDFGITALEAIACGKPAILHQQSGAAELVKPGKTGVLLQKLTVPEVVAAMDQIEELKFDPVMLQESVAEYATDAFVTNCSRELTAHWRRFEKERKI